jgi:hypothetical protein
VFEWVVSLSDRIYHWALGKLSSRGGGCKISSGILVSLGKNGRSPIFNFHAWVPPALLEKTFTFSIVCMGHTYWFRNRSMQWPCKAKKYASNYVLEWFSNRPLEILILPYVCMAITDHWRGAVWKMRNCFVTQTGWQLFDTHGTAWMSAFSIW